MTVYATADNRRDTMFMASPKTMVVSPSPKLPRIAVGALLNPTWPEELTSPYDSSPPRERYNSPIPSPRERFRGPRLTIISSKTHTGCFECGALFQCQSLLKKHEARHTKPFKCIISSCRRYEEGFSSKNDLTRHLNSVHKVAETGGKPVGYDCRYGSCKDKTKIYYRLDNFRNHLKKLHIDTQEPALREEFLKRAESECRLEDPPYSNLHSDYASSSGSSTPTRTYAIPRRTPSPHHYASHHHVLDDPKQAEFERIAARRHDLLQELILLDQQANALERDDNYPLLPPFPPNPSPPPREPQPKLSLPPNTTFPAPCPAPGCLKSLTSPSIARKHFTRHTRPYTCTSTNCSKDFGSKDDWKRHENTQHHRIDFWICRLQNKSGATCSLQWYRKENFVNHLKGCYHMVTDKAVLAAEERRAYFPAEQVKEFWCGFCGTEGRMRRLGKGKGWDDRFNHIERHFLEEGKRYRDDWVEPVAGVQGRREGGTWVCCRMHKDEVSGKGLAGGEECGECGHERCPECLGGGRGQEGEPSRKRGRQR